MIDRRSVPRPSRAVREDAEIGASATVADASAQVTGHSSTNPVNRRYVTASWVTDTRIRRPFFTFG